MLSIILLQASDWALFFGRFHPVLVHLPIGFLLVAALLEIGRRMGKVGVSDSTITFILFWSAIGATLACIAGYLLSQGGGYEQELLDVHMWQGIGVAVLAWIAWAVKSDLLGERIPMAPLFYMPALLIGSALTMVAGHHGGSLTHGDGYLTQYTPEPFRSLAGMAPRTEQVTEIKPIADVNQAIVYKDIVQPILNTRCVQCHSATKQKGDLRMDSFDRLLKGGENGPALVVGKSTDSEMLKRCLLPLEDDNHMPPKGKTQLTEQQIALLSWWIDQGAPTDKKVADLQVTDALKPALASLTTGGTGTAVASAEPSQSPVLSLQVPAPDAGAVASLKKTNLLVMPLAQDQHLVEISAVNAPAFADAQAAMLTPLAEQIVWLKLGNTKVSDAALSEVAKLKNLNKLHLEHTAVTDAGLAKLKDMQYLEYLNLIGTKVTDSGLKALAGLKGLKSIYVWQSQVTDSGIADLRKARPDLVIVNGLTEAAVAEFLKAGEVAKSADLAETSKK
ncbi:c-type cytochrome domain-containing protein [Telluribacter humicola]|uniref:c-type cytochrome domain-containing protein n=1 Tax=Telluribacter humicola TaxID=1720261 RepID=UPI001A96CC61|nr:c-type cytochrome domain-containing protein [Telluribacter humicola]